MSVTGRSPRGGAAVPAATGVPAASGLLARTFESLHDRDFRYFWGGMLLLMGGVNIQMLARGQLAYDLTGSPLAVGLVGAGFAPPILLLSLFGGVVADRFDRKRIIQTGQLVSMFIALFVAVSIVTGTITLIHLVAASLMQGTMWAFLMPARQAIIPQIVGRDRMVNAIALNSSGMALMTLAAPGIGGLVYAGFGAAAAYFVIVGLAGGAFVLTGFLPDVGRQQGRAGGAVLSDMKEGLRYVLGKRTVMSLLVLGLGTTVLAMPFRSLLPVLVDDVFSRGPEAVGLLMSMIGLGALLGSLAFAGMRAGSRRGLVLISTTILSGVSILLVTAAPMYGAAVAIMVLVGIGDSGRRTLNSALIMEQTDDEHRGRVMGVYMMNFGLMPLGAIPIAALAEVIGISYAISISAALLAAVGLGFMAFSRGVRRL